jgi:hypothetical protein
VKYDDFGLSEGEWLAAATLIPLIWQTPLSPYEIDVEDGNKIQKFFDLPIQSMGNRTCNEVAQLAGMQLVDGEKAYRANRLQLANAYLDRRRIII